MASRKEFLRMSAALTAGLTLPFSLPGTARSSPISQTLDESSKVLKKGYMLGTFPSRGDYSLMEQFQMLKSAGFDGAEPDSGLNRDEVMQAMEASGLEIPSVVVSTHWSHPLSSPDAETRQTGLQGLQTALEDADAYGAKCVLLVPGAVSRTVSYEDAWNRSQEEIRKAVPLAEELGVAIAIENVWNQFLLSPLEAARYVDAFESPAVGWYMDVGNIRNFGFADQWIRILGPRIKMVHFKEYSMQLRNQEGPGAGFRVNFLEGDKDWPAVMSALREIEYSGGYAIAEPSYRNPETDHKIWLKEYIADRMDQIFGM
ncbi:MAG: sugar phosphate isomerase/epimerase [Balneolaceae bacterium]|nr:MAG: sugar phosphate isomerase/epimerase [Balneolaceae bacterium]